MHSLISYVLLVHSVYHLLGLGLGVGSFGKRWMEEESDVHVQTVEFYNLDSQTIV